jgi:general secretion pathway protein C
MKRMSIVYSLLAVILLSASLAYWGLQLFKPPARPQVAAQQAALPEPAIDAAAGLFGGQSVAVVSSYQLKGVVAAVPARDGVAIIAADGKPPQAYKVGQEVAPGVTVKEVTARYITLQEGGVAKRIELPADAKGGTSLSQGGSGNPPPAANPPQQPPPQPSIPVPPPPPTMNPAPTIVQPPTQ